MPHTEQEFEYQAPDKIIRAMQVESSNNESRTVEISFSSEALIDKGSYYEQLSHNIEDVDLTWANTGFSPVLLDHEVEKHIGVIESATIDTVSRKGRAVVRIATDDKSEQAWIKIKDKVLVNTSIGCKVTGYSVDKESADKPIVRCKWALQEVSFTALPVDKDVGVQRSEKNSDLDNTKSEAESTVIDSVLPPDNVNQVSDVNRSLTKKIEVEVTNPITKQNQLQNNKKDLKMTIEQLSTEDIQRAERLRTNEIYAIADEFKASREDVQRAVESGQAPGEFALAIMRAKKTQPVQTALGLTNQEAKEYSIARAVQAIITGDHSDAGYEIEVSRAYAKANGKAHKATSLYVPDEVIRAASANAMTATANAAVGLKTRGAWIESLRAKTIAGRLGVNMVGGLVGTLELPKFLTLPQARFVNEGQDGTLDAVTTGVVTLAPRSVISLVEVTRSMVNNLPSIEAQLNQELLAAIATRIDQEVFATVLADTDVIANLKVTPASGVNYAEIRALLTKLSNADVNTDVAKFAMNGDVQGYLTSTLKAANTAALFLMGEDGKVAGLQSEYSRTVGGDHLLVGDWSKVTVGAWGGIELAADTSTKFASGGTQLRAIADVDVGVTVPAAITGYKDLVV